MKRREIIKKLEAAGYTFEEGGNHTRIIKGGKRVSVLSRQREIAEVMVIVIEKQTGVQLR